MSRFGRRSDGGAGARSAAERERARLEREARRAGTPLPPPEPVAPPEPVSAPEPIAPPDPAEPPEPVAPPEPPQPEPPQPEARAVEPAPEPPAPVRDPQPDWFQDEDDEELPAAPATPAAEPPTAAFELPPRPFTEELDALEGDPPPIEPLPPRRRSLPRAAPTAAGVTSRRASGGPGPGASHTRGVLVVIALAFVALALWFAISLFQPFAGDPGGPVTVRIPQGSSAGDIGSILADEGVVSSGMFFGLRATLAGKRGDLKPGVYTLREDMTYGDAIDAIAAGPPPPRIVRVTIPEGRSIRETAPLVAKAGLTGDYAAAARRAAAQGVLNLKRLHVPASADTLEGFLFPATYELKAGRPASALVTQQLEAFRDRFAGVDTRYARRKNLTAYDVVTIASMVEREAMLDKERPLIAAVIYNRLKAGIPLGIDATTRYELNNWTTPLTGADLRRDTPYNTRTHRGLPPTPIGSPGLASLKAAARPKRVGYLYYVVKPGTCGEHAFSATAAQFERDVQRYQRARERNGGQSPTTC